MPRKSKNALAFSLSVQYASDAKFLPMRAQFRRWVKAALQQPAQITLRVVEEEEGRALNAQFRKKNYSTNVLSFVYDDVSPLSGDIVFCAPVVAAEAKQQKKTLEAHYAHLTIHGVLHLQGYDHEKKRDAKIMETLETRIMRKLGYADPYHADQQ
jgi:probable rRNA maturation factor